ncbi:MAG TPA: twin-arginine translocation signal domain-containing protein [Pyrinomonadaceae bacterium]|jgi:hypothetical protein|nr:twin-arginine translocation signal domain-containing protein [Pyrinomonadaceae bacterium]
MDISRRKFLRTGTVVALAAGIPLQTIITASGQQNGASHSSANGFPIPAEVQSDPIFNYTKATFAAHVNSTFQVRSKRTKAVDITLVDVHDSGPVPDQLSAGRECFSLVFRAQHKIRQDTYTVEHGALGTFALLLVPIGKDKKGSYYEAIINRLNP